MYQSSPEFSEKAPLSYGTSVLQETLQETAEKSSSFLIEASSGLVATTGLQGCYKRTTRITTRNATRACNSRDRNGSKKDGRIEESTEDKAEKSSVKDKPDAATSCVDSSFS